MQRRRMLFEDTYLTIASRSEGLYKEKGSRFIAIAIPVSGEDEVKAELAALRKKYHDARHHCYAYRLGFDKSAMRMNDDGEPSGTAGKPIYGQLLSADLTNILIVVVRYFGGIKLGVSGLIQAYRAAARDALGNATILEKTVREVYRLSFTYEVMNEVMKLLKDEGLEQSGHRFESDCEIDFTVRKSEAGRVRGLFLKIKGLSIKYMKTT